MCFKIEKSDQENLIGAFNVRIIKYIILLISVACIWFKTKILKTAEKDDESSDLTKYTVVNLKNIDCLLLKLNQIVNKTATKPKVCQEIIGNSKT